MPPPPNERLLLLPLLNERLLLLLLLPLLNERLLPPNERLPPNELLFGVVERGVKSRLMLERLLFLLPKVPPPNVPPPLLLRLLSIRPLLNEPLPKLRSLVTVVRVLLWRCMLPKDCPRP